MSHLHLATTGISEIWSKDDEIVYLGPWCLGLSERLTGNHEFVPSPWRCRERLFEAVEYSSDLCQRTMIQLVEQLNRVHGVSHDDKYWSTLVAPWLLRFIQVFYERYLRVKLAHDGYPSFKTNILLPDDSRLTTANTAVNDRYELGDHFFNLKFYSYLIREMCPEHIGDYVAGDVAASLACSAAGRQGDMQRDGYVSKKGLLRNLCDLFGCIGNADVVMARVSSLNREDKTLLRMRAGFGSIRNIDMMIDGLERKCSSAEYDPELRSRMEFAGARTECESLLNRKIAEAIPICFMEGFGALKDAARSLVEDVKPKYVLSDCGWNNDDAFKYFAAEAAHDGAKLVELQQGGGVKLSRSVFGRMLARHRDVVFTWAETVDALPNASYLPSVRLSKLFGSHKGSSDDVLFVGAASKRYPHVFNSTLQPDDVVEYYKDKLAFLNSLPKRVLCRILYRPYGRTELEECEVIRKAYPDLRCLRSRDTNSKIVRRGLVQWMRRARVVVIDHPHTSYLQALAINAPCIFYWDRGVFQKWPSADKYLDLLAEVGILHDSPESAAKKLAQVYDDPGPWWHDEKVQYARMKFLGYVARPDIDWLKVWTARISSLRSNGVKSGRDDLTAGCIDEKRLIAGDC